MGELKRAVRMTWEWFFCRNMEALTSHKSQIRRQLLDRDANEQGNYPGRNKRKEKLCVKYNQLSYLSVTTHAGLIEKIRNSLENLIHSVTST